MDATDGSSGMLEEAKKLGVYQNLFPKIVSYRSLQSSHPRMPGMVTSHQCLFALFYVSKHCPSLSLSGKSQTVRPKY